MITIPHLAKIVHGMDDLLHELEGAMTPSSSESHRQCQLVSPAELDCGGRWTSIASSFSGRSGRPSHFSGALSCSSVFIAVLGMEMS